MKEEGEEIVPAIEEAELEHKKDGVPVKDEDMFSNRGVSVPSSPESIDMFNDIFSVPSNNKSIESVKSSPTGVLKISIEAQMILDSLPDLEVLQKSYLLILDKGNNNPLLS